LIFATADKIQKCWQLKRNRNTLHYFILLYARALAAKGLNDWQTAEPEKSLGKCQF